MGVRGLKAATRHHEGESHSALPVLQLPNVRGNLNRVYCRSQTSWQGHPLLRPKATNIVHPIGLLTLKPSRRTSDRRATQSQTRNAASPADDNKRGALARNVVRGRLFRYNPRLLGNRLAVGQRTLDPLAEVRILVPQPTVAT